MSAYNTILKIQDVKGVTISKPQGSSLPDDRYLERAIVVETENGKTLIVLGGEDVEVRQDT